MSDINKCIFTGRLGADPVLKATTSGRSVCSFSIAVDRPKAKDAEKAETDWIDIVTWQSTAEFVAKYLSKGRKIVAECVARPRKWQDSDGKQHKVVEFHASNIIVADAKPQNAENTSPAMPLGDGAGGVIASDDDLPF